MLRPVETAAAKAPAGPEMTPSAFGDRRLSGSSKCRRDEQLFPPVIDDLSGKLLSRMNEVD